MTALPTTNPTARRRIRPLIIAAIAAVLTVAGCAQLAQKERELVFRVEPGEARWFSGMPAGIQDLDIPVKSTEGGAEGTQKLHAWWWPAADPKAPALLYLHGARWNLTGQLFRIEQLHEFGFSVLAIDYRGFGKSDGEMPSEQTVYEDALAGWERLAQLQPDAARRFIYGHSLGGAVAVDLAARLSAAGGAGAKKGADGTSSDPLAARGLIVESSFTTLADMARALSVSWLPVGMILSQKFDSAAKIAAVRMSVLVVHGRKDRYVPARFSEKLYEAVAAPKKLLLIEGGSHNNSMRSGSAAYRKALSELFGLNMQRTAVATQ